MNFTSLKHIRQQLYKSLERGADALFNLGEPCCVKAKPSRCLNCRCRHSLSGSGVWGGNVPNATAFLDEGTLSTQRNAVAVIANVIYKF